MKEQKIYLTELYDEFRCLGGDCPQTCCRGWLLPVDAATHKAYLTEKGFPGCLLPLTLSGGGDHPLVIRKFCGRCPFHTSEGLCRHQKRERLDLMPLTCRLYPRTSLQFNNLLEVTLELSCVEVARIFLRHPGRLALNERPDAEPIEIGWTAASPAEEFITFLREKREKLLDYLWDDALPLSFLDRQRGIYRHIRALHNLLAQDKLSCATTLTMEDQDSFEDDLLSKRTSLHSFFPIPFVNRLIYQPIELTQIRFREPHIYKLLRRYRKEFGNLFESESDDFFDQKINALLRKYPFLEKTFTSYCSYLLQQTLLTASEDYYLLRPVLLSLLQVQFFMLFCLLSDEAGDALTPERLALILSGCEKALAHNPGLSDVFLREIRSEFF